MYGSLKYFTSSSLQQQCSFYSRFNEEYFVWANRRELPWFKASLAGIIVFYFTDKEKYNF